MKKSSQRGEMLFWWEGGSGGGWCRTSPALQCWAPAANGAAAVGVGAGPEADDSQGEFSVRRRWRLLICEGGKSEEKSAGVQRCSENQDSSRGAASLLLFLRLSSCFISRTGFLLSALDRFLLLLTCSPWTCNSPCFSWWMKRVLSVTSSLFGCPPCCSSHGHPCFLQVGCCAGRGATLTDAGFLDACPVWDCRSPWGILPFVLWASAVNLFSFLKISCEYQT